MKEQPVVGRSVLEQLTNVIEDRKLNPGERSYTARLLAGGLEKIGAKVLEEAHEVVEAAGEPDAPGREHLVREAADLLYHLLVLLAWRDASLADVEQVLAGRFGISGLDEKAARSSSASSSSAQAGPST